MATKNNKEEKLKILADLLEKSGLRKYTCMNGSGYSVIERDIVDALQGDSIEETVSWDDARDEYGRDETTRTFTRWMESKYNLTRKQTNK